ncbi:MAG: RND transporter, partial [Chthoniobacterales bacterium]
TFAGRAADSSLERYKQGLVSYTAVIEAQRTQLQTQLHATQILGLELISTVHLIKALGGGFKESIH